MRSRCHYFGEGSLIQNNRLKTGLYNTRDMEIDSKVIGEQTKQARHY